MSNIIGILVYKCRRCGKLNKNVHVPDGLIALSLISANESFPAGWGDSYK